ncbi:hypothetical protein G6F59_015535 [Rhizopus arrhizus]|nr:hypothetical protein G6F59_015535 [Rhizopus arrhizus]
MREAEQQFVHDLGRADGARQRDQPGIRRVAVDEMVLVEARQLLVAHAARHRRDMVHVGFGHHRGHGGGHIARAEFIFAVLVPQGRIIELRADGALQGRHAALVRHQGGRLVVVVAAGTRERVVHARIHVELHARLAAQRGEDALACLGRTEAILLGNVQHQAAAQPTATSTSVRHAAR